VALPRVPQQATKAPKNVELIAVGALSEATNTTGALALLPRTRTRVQGGPDRHETPVMRLLQVRAVPSLLVVASQIPSR